jgi:hypothetical protein
MSIVGRGRVALALIAAVGTLAACCPGDCIKPAPCAPPPPKKIEVKKVEPMGPAAPAPK